MKKRILTAVLMLCMAFSLVACGGDSGSNNDTEKENTQQDSQTANDSEEDSQTESEETGVVYTIKVVDENGNPVGSVMVQLCKDSCMPKMTDANGVAEFQVNELSDQYKAGVTVLPEGYTYDGDEYVYFENGATEVTIVIKTAQ